MKDISLLPFLLFYMILLVGAIAGIIHHHTTREKTSIIDIIEEAYYKGQFDALTNDIRIEVTPDSTSYIITKDCWNK
jgi:hypothetical protein